MTQVSINGYTTEYGNGRKQIESTLSALESLKMQTIMLWPNVDAGSDDISKGIRTFRENNNTDWLRLHINLPTKVYIHLMNETACLVGNSSSGIREGAFIGTPVVNIGTRQELRERGENVLDVGYSDRQILEAIEKQMKFGKYKSNEIYGSGDAGYRICKTLSEINPPLQKQISY